MIQHCQSTRPLTPFNRPAAEELADVGHSLGRDLYDAHKSGNRLLAAKTLTEIRAVLGLDRALIIERFSFGLDHQRVAAALLAENRTTID